MHGVSDGHENDWTSAAFREHERYVWSVAYRMTGSVEDADDVVQETFAKAIERPPAERSSPVRPWLVHVAVNVARDVLRRRKTRAYVGPWLPAPVETSDVEGLGTCAESTAAPGSDAAARYDLRESASFAFLIALEALTPQQRAVLVLREVCDYSVHETARALALSEANVKTTHHRARRAMDFDDCERRPMTPERGAKAREALERFVLALASEDAAAMETCLAEDVRAVSDAGGEYQAALRSLHGRDHVARFFLGLQKKNQWKGRFALAQLNGLPAIVGVLEGQGARYAPRFVLRVEVDDDAVIHAMHLVLATPKLRGVRSWPL